MFSTTSKQSKRILHFKLTSRPVSLILVLDCSNCSIARIYVLYILQLETHIIRYVATGSKSEQRSEQWKISHTTRSMQAYQKTKYFDEEQGLTVQINVSPYKLYRHIDRSQLLTLVQNTRLRKIQRCNEQSKLSSKRKTHSQVHRLLKSCVTFKLSGFNENFQRTNTTSRSAHQLATSISFFISGPCF